MRIRTSLAALLFVFAGAGALLAGDRHGKMPITTSSPEALVEYDMGTAYLDRFQRDKARPHFERAVELDPDFIMAWIGLARSQARIRDTQEIMTRVYEMVETAQVSQGERLVLESLVAGRNGDRETPEKNTRKLAVMYPDDERCQKALGDLHYGKKEYEQAIEAYEKGLEADAGFVPIYNVLGYTYRNVGDYGRAEKTFRTAIELDPGNPNAYDSYAELLLKMGRFEESIESYEHALEVDPLFPSAVMGIASNLMHLGRHDEARARLQAVDDIAPHDGIRSGVCWAMSVTYVDQGNFESALEELEKNYAFSEKIEDVTAMSIDLSNMATLLMESGRTTKAREYYARSLELRLQVDRPERVKNLIRAFNLYTEGRLAVAEGHLDDADSIVQQFAARVEEIDGGPGMVRAAHELAGIVALARGQYDRAIEELKQANTVTAGNMYRLAQAYEGRGDTGAARDMYQGVVDYRGGLNVEYSLVRHKAKRKLAAL